MSRIRRGSRSLLTFARKVLSLFPRRARWQLVALLGAEMLMGLLQVAGIGSILPFISVLTDQRPGGTGGRIVSSLTERLGLEGTGDALLVIGAIAVGILVASNIFLGITMWLLSRFAWAQQYRLSRQLLARYLANPYVSFLDRNSADLGKNILSETQNLTNGVVLPALKVIAFGATSLFIIGFLVWLNPLFASIVAIVLGGGFLAVYRLLRRTVMRAGRRRIRANRLRFQAVNEAFGGLKEIKVLGRERWILDRFDRPARTFYRSMVVQQVATQLPRYMIEILAFGGVLLLVLYVGTVGGDVGQVLPLAGVYAFAGYRLMPALHQIYVGVSQVRFNAPVVDEVLSDLEESQAGARLRVELGSSGPEFSVREGIRLQRVSFTYPGASRPAISGIDLSVPAHSWVAFVGETGAGKTTLVDVVLGLLRPQEGQIVVDGRPVEDPDVRAWQRSLGYVPQEIYLADDTVAGNIAFGLPRSEIDMQAVGRAARIARIHGFVVDELPDGYDTYVGERGVRISGGQRQRIGIARAVYHDPSTLVLDEGTSALDGATESMVLQAIEELTATSTVIMIAHRLTSVRGCDRIFLMDGGRIVAEGTYEELLEGNARFRTMAG